jgi:hypothetical protein
MYYTMNTHSIVKAVRLVLTLYLDILKCLKTYWLLKLRVVHTKRCPTDFCNM